MKIFNKDYKVNFVDDNNVVVGFDDSQNCCENFGWSITKEIPTYTGNASTEPDEPDTEGYLFDVLFYEEVHPQDKYFDCGGMVVFKLTKKGEDNLYLSLYNSHNGYYSHGFFMEVGGKRIHNNSL
tara:strand:+ start:144 stop:518 length:375 start_codon:yes stop_codon:yes gene_type:complete